MSDGNSRKTAERYCTVEVLEKRCCTVEDPGNGVENGGKA